MSLAADPSRNSWSLAVTDHGPGIPENFRSQIFQRFERADNSNTRRKGGTGLGLALTRKIVERHGGTVWAEGDVDAGCDIGFTLPLVAKEPA